MIQIVYADEVYIPSFAETLDAIAREEIFLEMVQAPPYPEIFDFQAKQIKEKLPVFYAVSDQQVVGWVDVAVSKNPRQRHKGTLGMGILKAFRSQKIGSLLMEEVIQYSRQIGLEKLELQVYTSNTQAIGLYKKFGFQQVGVIHKYRKYKDQYFDSVFMELLF